MSFDKSELRNAQDDWIWFFDQNVIFAAHPTDCARFLSTTDDAHRLGNCTPVVGISVSLNLHRLESSNNNWDRFRMIRIKYRLD